MDTMTPTPKPTAEEAVGRLKRAREYVSKHFSVRTNDHLELMHATKHHIDQAADLITAQSARIAELEGNVAHVVKQNTEMHAKWYELEKELARAKADSAVRGQMIKDLLRTQSSDEGSNAEFEAGEVVRVRAYIMTDAIDAAKAATP